jgi:hypothetical protein
MVATLKKKKTKSFTALMIVAAGVGDVSGFVQRILDLGADVHITDDEVSGRQ